MRTPLAARVAKLLPRRVRYWVVLQAWALYTTRPPWSSKHPDELGVSDMLQLLDLKGRSRG